MASFSYAFLLLTLSSMVLGLPRQTTTNMPGEPCASLASLHLPNTTILVASYVAAHENVTSPGTCQFYNSNAVNICRVYGMIETSSTSSVKFEVWMPDTWYGRLLSGGNFGVGGCIDYALLDYGTTLHFATVSADGGHDGLDAISFYHHPEVLKDFSYRSVHVASVVGKLITEAYYSKAPSKSYYSGCSTGGRQGIQSALLYPEDFDGIIAGSPALDWNNFIGSGAIISSYLNISSEKFIPDNLWSAITREIYKQCDGLDGLMDGMITEPDDCNFKPEALLCVDGQTESCLTPEQVDGLRMAYQPVYGTKGQLLWPRFDPGAELDKQWRIPMGGVIPVTTSDWMRYAIYNDSNHTIENFSVSDIEFADTINPAGIATWNGNLSAFRDRGGKLVSYHGRSDAYIPSGNSKRFYNLVNSTLSSPNLDDFMRLFLVPGMFHCSPGGAWAFGQGSITGPLTATINDTDHNLLLALVDWVEGGNAPDTIIGTDERLAERVHCRYPHRSVRNGTEWACA